MMDLTATTNRAPQAGETVTGIKFQTAPGGKGANQAVAAACAGAFFMTSAVRGWIWKIFL